MKATKKATTQAAATRRTTKVNRTSLKYLLLFLSWPVVLVHRYWNNRPPQKLSLIPFEKIEQDIQWYIKDTGDMLSISLILAAFYLTAKSIREKIVVGTFLLISIIDIGHYWLWYKRNESIIFIEGGIVVIAAVLMLVKFKSNAPTS